MWSRQYFFCSQLCGGQCLAPSEFPASFNLAGLLHRVEF